MLAPPGALYVTMRQYMFFSSSKQSFHNLSKFPLNCYKSPRIATTQRNACHNNQMADRTQIPRCPCRVLRWHQRINRKLRCSYSSWFRVIAQVYRSQEKVAPDYPDNLNIISTLPSSSLPQKSRFSGKS